MTSRRRLSGQPPVAGMGKTALWLRRVPNPSTYKIPPYSRIANGVSKTMILVDLPGVGYVAEVRPRLTVAVVLVVLALKSAVMIIYYAVMFDFKSVI